MNDFNSVIGSIDNPPYSPEKQQIDFEFRGRAGEYFGIWIVNVLLSIVTIGIYSAWAKVRRLRYFYGNTWLDGHNFDYHARAVQILIGRVVVVAILLGYNILLSFSPAFAFLGIVYLFLLPWAINKSIAFNARMTSHRNVRFGFQGSYGKAFWVYIGLPLIALLSLGLLIPFATRSASQYFFRGLRYGNSTFETEMNLGALYANFGVSVLFFAAVSVIVIAVPSFAYIPSAFDSDASLIVQFVFIGVYAGLFAVVPFYSAGVRNIAINGLTLDGTHGFVSGLGRLQFFWIGFSNLIVTLLTLGLMRPWAAIRSWRYTTIHTSMIAGGSLDEFVGLAGGVGNVGASEFVDIEMISVGV
jgi:uncharacterized membrane protein YjgN (DUF898 family)